jgi:hypothetical protein
MPIIARLVLGRLQIASICGCGKKYKIAPVVVERVVHKWAIH